MRTIIKIIYIATTALAYVALTFVTWIALEVWLAWN